MILIRVLLLSSAIIVSAKSLPTSTRDYEQESATELETKKTTDPIPESTEDPQMMLDKQSNSEDESSTVEFVFKDPEEGFSVQKGSIREEYTISNFPPKNEDKKLNILESSKENEIDTFGKDELYKPNNTGISNEELLPEAQIKRDQWLFNPQETSSITGGLPKYLRDAATPIHPFPELGETIRQFIFPSTSVKSENQVPATENIFDSLEITDQRHYKDSDSYESSEIAGPKLYPESAFRRLFADLFEDIF